MSGYLRFLRNTATRAVRTLLAAASVAVVGTGLWTGDAKAVPVSFDLIITPTDIGLTTPVLGLNTLPGGPIVATFDLDSSELTANRNNAAISLASLTDFDLTIGTGSWTEADAFFLQITTNALGELTRLHAGFTNATGSFSPFPIVPQIIATDPGQSCALNALNQVSTGNCLGGTYEIALSSESVPEPGILAILGLGLAGLGLARRRKTI